MGPDPAHQEARRRFDRLAAEYLDAALRLRPTTASAMGRHDLDGALEDLSPEGLRSEVETFRGFQVRLSREVPPEALDLGRRIDHRILLDDARANLFQLETLQSHRTDPTLYNDILGYSTLFLTLLPPGAPEWPERLQALGSRLERFPDLVAAARRNLENPSRIHVEFVVGANRSHLEFLERRIPELAEATPAVGPALQRAATQARMALREYQSWLETDLLPRAQGSWRLGRQRWEGKLRFTLQSDLTPAEIWSRAEAGLREERLAMQELADRLRTDGGPRQAPPERDPDARLREVLAAASHSHSSPESLLQDVRGWILRIKEFLRRVPLVSLPPDDDPLVVEPTPGFLNGLAVAFFNPPPAFEPWLKKSFWISSVAGKPPEFVRSYLREYNHYALQNLTVHEAFPGHYVQFWHALGSPVASIYKKVFASSAFAEGWAVLAEKLVYGAGYADGEPQHLLMHRKMQLRTYINAMLDQRFHVTSEEEASDEELDAWAVDLMCRQGFQEEAEARGKIRRAKVSSTQLSTYLVGYLELAALEERARARAGAAFEPRAFHDRLLSYGTIPPREVRHLLEEEGIV